MSTVVRLFDLRLASNRFVIVASAAFAGGVALLRSAGGWDLASPLVAALTVLLAWALARELDPDAPAAATVAAVVVPALFLAGPPSLRVVTAVLFAVRLLAETTGAPPTRFDLIWLPGIAAWSAGADGGLPSALALVAALAVGGRRQLASALVALVVAIGAAVWTGSYVPRPDVDPAWGWVVIAASSIAWIPFLRLRSTSARGDISGEVLVPARLRLARVVAAVTAISTVAWVGASAATLLSCLWAAMVGCALVSAASFASSRARGWH